MLVTFTKYGAAKSLTRTGISIVTTI